MLRALVVDDERPARSWICGLLKEHPQVEVTGEAASVAEAIEKAKAGVDVVFLDIQMPPANGFDLLPHLPPAVRVVFVTAHDTFAVKAFETNALDYLLKPVHPHRLAETISRLASEGGGGGGSASLRALGQGTEPEQRQAAPEQSQRQDGQEQGRQGQEQEREGREGQGRFSLTSVIPIADRDLMRVVAVGRIAAIQADCSYTHVLIAGEVPMHVFQSISAWERVLPVPPFARLDRSLLLNLLLIREVKSLSRNRTQVVLEGGEVLGIGRSASLRLRKLLKR